MHAKKKNTQTRITELYPSKLSKTTARVCFHRQNRWWNVYHKAKILALLRISERSTVQLIVVFSVLNGLCRSELCMPIQIAAIWRGEEMKQL